MKDTVLSPDEAEAISRAVIADLFIDDNKLILTPEQRKALIKLIKDCAEWGRNHPR